MRLSLLLLALSLSLPAIAQPAQTAKELNTEGFRLYQAGKYPEALAKFRAATEKDPKHALAHYNVAATLGVLRKQGKVCEYEAYTNTILEYLERSIKLDPKRLKRAKEDPDLEPIRETMGWQILLGRSPKRAKDMPVILRSVKWYGPGVGVYGTLEKLRFEDNGKVVLSKKTPQDEGPPKEEEITGTYSVKGLKALVKFPGQEPIVASFFEKEDNALVFENATGIFYDYPSECEA
jgi:tetratricopeptide (TPR) repeat protein